MFIFVGSNTRVQGNEKYGVLDTNDGVVEWVPATVIVEALRKGIKIRNLVINNGFHEKHYISRYGKIDDGARISYVKMKDTFYFMYKDYILLKLKDESYGKQYEDFRLTRVEAGISLSYIGNRIDKNLCHVDFEIWCEYCSDTNPPSHYEPYYHMYHKEYRIDSDGVHVKRNRCMSDYEAEQMRTKLWKQRRV